LTDLALMQQLVTRVPVPSPRTVDPEIPEELERICVKALATSPDDRFQTALEMQDALEEFLSADSIGGTNRALGKFMGKAFHEKRAQFQRVIDEQTRAAAEIPLDIEFTGSVSRMRAQGLPVLGSEGEPEGAASLGPLSSASRMKAARDGTSTGSSPEVVASFVMASAPPSPLLRRRWVGLVGIGVAVALVTSLIVLFFRASPARDASPSSASSSATLALAASRVSPSPASSPAAASGEPPGTGAMAPGGTPSASTAVVVAVDTAAARRAAAAPQHTTMVIRPRTSTSGEARPSAPAVEAPAKHEVDCTSPYFIDDQGMKKVRVECL
jgi:hypothetical protein